LLVLEKFWMATEFFVRKLKQEIKIVLMQTSDEQKYRSSVADPSPTVRMFYKKHAELAAVSLSDEQQQLFDRLENSSSHFFVTGKAGTGKSVLLQHFKYTSNKKLVVVAPTGVAALNVGGQTIHSLFHIPPEFITKDSLRLDYPVAHLLRQLDAVVIDEVSMVRADLMDGIDYLLRSARRSDLPFGGVQMILFGDLFQLPPVVSDPELHKYFADNHGGFYFFNADVWKTTSLEIVELSHVFRQHDESFKMLLNAIRNGSADETVLAQLNKRASTAVPSEGTITLATTNQTVNEINEKKLAALPGQVYEYYAEITGKLEKQSFPTEEILKLKPGAQVMLLKNDTEKRWVNGTLATIYSLSKEEVKINIDGIIYSVSPATWSKVRYTYNRTNHKIEEEVTSSFTQFPLRLAWAVTIHKSQGHTYHSVIIDMGAGAFTHGQTYVALSRCTNLETIYLKQKIIKEDIIVDRTVIAFMEKAIVLQAT